MTADNRFEASIDGVVVLKGDNWKQLFVATVALAPGEHALEVACVNDGGPAAFAATIKVGDRLMVSDGLWLADGEAAISLGLTKAMSGPWSDPFAEALATLPSKIHVPEGFEVELLYSAQPGEGSWSALAMDAKGRAILSPQYGPLLRITPGTSVKVERLHETLGKAHGLLVIDNELYVNVADGKKAMGGLWRMRDTDGNDTYDDVQRLAAYSGGSEHGPHGLRLGPDGMLYMIHGNMAERPEPLAETSPHQNWREEIVLERTWDPRGHAHGIMSPGGVLLRTDRDGSSFELVAAGMRNAYDIAFNEDGELFTYDSDMEWDIGAPWYRTPRLLHLVSGGEFGWRSGSAKWPIDSPDARPAVLELDAGSPTGVASGHLSSWPEPWRSRMYLADWAFGRVLSVELIPEGASYTGRVDETPFILGRPFNVSDLAFGPEGDLFLIIGGRGSQSGLYRVSWVGDANEEKAPRSDGTLRAERRRIEHSHRDATALSKEDLLQAMAHDDLAVRYAARIGLERKLLEGDAEWFSAAYEGQWELAAAGLRAGDSAVAKEVLDQLEEVDDDVQRARLLFLLLSRHAPLEPAMQARAQALAEDVYPTGIFASDRHLVEVLVALDSEAVVSATMDRLDDGATPEETLHFLHALRRHGIGWTEPDKDRAIEHLASLESHAGGASLKGFVNATNVQLLATIERERPPAVVVESNRADRTFVRAWTIEEIAPHVTRVYAYRDFSRGKALYESLDCASCHRFGDVGKAYGPDLTAVGGRFSPRDLLLTMLEPARDLSDQYAAIAVTLTNGDTIVGMKVQENDDTITIAPDPRMAKANVEISKADIKERSATTVMPPGLLSTCTMDEILDLLAYLATGGNQSDPAFKRPP